MIRLLKALAVSFACVMWVGGLLALFFLVFDYIQTKQVTYNNQRLIFELRAEQRPLVEVTGSCPSIVTTPHDVVVVEGE